MGDKKSKSDIDMLSELSCMASNTSRERKSTLNDGGSDANVGFTSKFKSEKEMNDYIQKCINDSLNQKPKPNGAVRVILNLSSPKGVSVNEGINIEDYPAKMSSTAEWLKVLNRCGRFCNICKIDYYDAYKHIGVRGQDTN